jgi:hypothetical protein
MFGVGKRVQVTHSAPSKRIGWPQASHSGAWVALPPAAYRGHRADRPLGENPPPLAA